MGDDVHSAAGQAIPFREYPDGGQRLLGRPKGDVARRGYGRQVLQWCGHRCAYCGLDMTMFEGWLQLSVDHVIPQQAIAAGFPEDWVLDTANLVACCRPCNDLFNRDPVIEPAPITLEGFLQLRDRLFLARQARIMERRENERAWFAEHVLPGHRRPSILWSTPAPVAQENDIPKVVTDLVRDQRASLTAQAPMAWPRKNWIEAFPDRADRLATLPRGLDRSDLQKLGTSAADDPESAEFAFIAVMAWGFGNVGYGPFRTKRILTETPGAADRLRSVAEAVARNGAIAGYRRLATDCRLRYLGPAFGTKFLYFTQAADRRPRALILDAFVSRWLGRETSHDFGVATWSERTYAEYLDLMHGWAAKLGCEPDLLEYSMFQEIANERGSQWAGIASD
jgi:hypothetical protein